LGRRAAGVCRRGNELEQKGRRPRLEVSGSSCFGCRSQRAHAPVRLPASDFDWYLHQSPGDHRQSRRARRSLQPCRVPPSLTPTRKGRHERAAARIHSRSRGKLITCSFRLDQRATSNSSLPLVMKTWEMKCRSGTILGVGSIYFMEILRSCAERI
jgi:hypothetical protein